MNGSTIYEIWEELLPRLVEEFRPEWEKAHPSRQYSVCKDRVFKWIDKRGTPFNMFKYSLRGVLVKKFAWAIPSPDAIRKIIANSPKGVIQIGCGGGHWAWVLRESGLDVVAYDKYPGEAYGEKSGTNSHFKTWIDDIQQGDESNAGDHPDKTLFLCWPCYDDPWASAATEKYLSAGGKTVIYIGEGGGGCTADDRFHDEIVSDMARGSLDIPCWDGIHDRLYIYKA